MASSASALRRLDADEHADEVRLLHQLENVGLLGDVERRLAGEHHRIVVALLPLDEMRQHLLGGLAVADEIVVDEVERGRRVRLREDEIELGDDLLRRLHARLAAVKARDVAELAEVRAARRELHRAEQVAAERDLVVGGNREVGERQALLGRRTRTAAAAAPCSHRARGRSGRWRRPFRRCGDSRSPDTSPATPRPTARPAP